MKSQTAFITLSFALLSGISPCHGQTLSEKIDLALKESLPTDRPGVVALVSQGQDVVFHKAYGLADLELDVPMAPDMRFTIASVTKQFTAVAILMLMERGQLSLDDSITKYIEDYPTHGHTITIHHLLTHTSGIRNYTKIGGTSEFAVNDFDTIDFIRFFSKAPMDFAPGQKRRYSNSGYYILGYIIEKLSGQPYGEFLAKNIFEPLGISRSQFGSNEEVLKGRASGYVHRDGRDTNASEFNVHVPFAAGALISSAGDLQIWNSAIHGGKLVKEETLNLAFKNYETDLGEATNYGYGFGLGNIHGRSTIEHDGGIQGFGSYAVYFPHENVFVVILSNCSNCFDLGELMNRVTKVVFPEQ